MSAARILVVDDESDIRGLLKEILTEEGYAVEVAADAQAARLMRQKQSPDLVLLDIWMPGVDGITLLREWSQVPDGCPVIMISGHGTVETAVEATRLGAFDFIEKPLSIAKLLRTVERGLEAGRRRRRPGRALLAQAPAPTGKSRVMQQLRTDLQQIASSRAPVLLIGEPGTDQELCARYLHAAGLQPDSPFINLVASTLRESDAEAQLLGGDGARGLLEQAADGTLFINEVEDLPQAAQRVLLGALESGVFSPLGTSVAQRFAARVLSSAQPGVEHRAGGSGAALRRDLLGHLNALIVRVPPLRDYAEDIPELLRHYVDQAVDADGLPFRRFSVAAQNRLRNYPWPDNSRELKNLVQRLLVQGTEEEISLAQIERELAVQTVPDEPLVKQDLLALPLREAREQFERAYLQQQLLLCNGKVGQLAKRVGMERTHLYRKLRSLGVDFRASADD